MQKVKISRINIGVDDFITLYFCPYCKKGHQVKKYIEKCDKCGGAISWEELEKEGKK